MIWLNIGLSRKIIKIRATVTGSHLKQVQNSLKQIQNSLKQVQDSLKQVCVLCTYAVNLKGGVSHLTTKERRRKNVLGNVFTESIEVGRKSPSRYTKGIAKAVLFRGPHIFCLCPKALVRESSTSKKDNMRARGDGRGEEGEWTHSPAPSAKQVTSLKKKAKSGDSDSPPTKFNRVYLPWSLGRNSAINRSMISWTLIKTTQACS